MSDTRGIKTKLLVGFGAMLGVLLALSIAWILQTRGLTKGLEKAVGSTARKQQLAGEIRTAAAEMLAGENGIVLGSVLQRTVAVAQSKIEFRNGFDRIARAVSSFRQLSELDGSGTGVSSLETQLSVAGRAHEEMMSFLDKQQFDQVQKTFDENVYPRLKQIGEQSEALAKQEEERLTTATAEARSQTARAYWLVGLFMVLAGASGAVVFFFVDQTIRQLRLLASQVQQGSEQVASAAAQVCSASQSLAHCASEQAAALEETSASMEQMSAVTHKNSDNSRATAALTEESERVVGEAEHTVRELSGSMQEISASGDKITKVVNMIDNIAFQTKILSLNAAVEAARAGTAGAGFAVVADQIGHLAQECADAARSTAEMIEDTVVRVRDGGAKLIRAAQVIQEVVSQAAKVRVLVDEVKAGSEEQSRGIDQVSKAVIQMEQMTQRTAANAEETASAGQQLDSYSDSLNKIVARMNSLVGGGVDAGYPPRGWTDRETPAAPLPAVSRAVAAKRSRAPASHFPAVQTPSGKSLALEEEFKDF